MKQLIDFIYPSFCIFCKNKADDNDLFCSVCVKHLVLEMNDSVMHVLEENPVSISYLKFIRKSFSKKHIKTLAAFTVIKYFRVFKNVPEYVFSSNNKLACMVGKHTAKILKKPFKKNMNTLDKNEEEQIFFSLNKKSTKQLKII